MMLESEVSGNGKTNLCFISGNNEGYTENLGAYLLPPHEPSAGSLWISRQDAAMFHTSKWTRQWILENNVKTINWPAMIPVLNIIANIWSWLAIKVYSGNSSYSSLKDLKLSIERAWNDLPEEFNHHKTDRSVCKKRFGYSLFDQKINGPKLSLQWIVLIPSISLVIQVMS